MPVIPVKNDKGRFGNDNTAAAHIYIDILCAKVNTDIRRQKRHKTIIL